MLPFQTPDFDPSDAGLLDRVHRGPCMHVGFHIGASAHDLDGERWIYLGTEGLTPGHTALVYPLPASFGDEAHRALSLFQDHWKAEARKLGLVDRMLEERARVLAETASREAARIAALPKPRRPKPRPHELSGAVALPGMEWEAGFRPGR